MFAATGDAQTSVMVARIRTTDDTVDVEMLLDGSSKHIVTADNHSYALQVLVIARDEGSAASFSSFRDVTVTRGTGAASLVIDNDTENTSAGTLVVGGVTVNADTTNGYIRIDVTGIAATNIKWVARVTMVEVAV
jgi:hypothetical protein